MQNGEKKKPNMLLQLLSKLFVGYYVILLIGLICLVVLFAIMYFL